MQILGFAFVLLGCFLFLLGLFDGFFLPTYWDGPLFWYKWIYSASFYSGIGFVITGSVSLLTARNMTTRRETDPTAGTNDQKLSRRMRLRHFPIDVGIGLLAGLISLAVNTFVASATLTEPSGFPYAVNFIIPSCFSPGPRACLSYDPLNLVLDFAFWGIITFVIVAFTDFITTLSARTRLTSVTVRKINQ